jgi:capsular exopolysaccharide synthesis family protein
MTETKTLPPYQLKRPETMAVQDENVHAGLYSYLYILTKRKRILAGSILVCLLFAFIINSTAKPVYESSTEVVLQPKETDSDRPAAINPILQDPTFLLTQIRFIRSPLLANQILKRVETAENRKGLLDCFHIKGDEAVEEGAIFSPREREALVNSIRGSLSAAQVERGARIISITVTGFIPQMVKELADAAADSYIELNYESQIESFKKSFSVISRSLTEIREKIKTGEIAANKISKELELLEALKIYGDKHPLVINLKTTIASLIQTLQFGIKNLETMEVGQRKNRFSLLTEPHTDLNELVQLEADLQNLKPLLDQEIRTNRELYDSLFKRLQEVELSGGKSLWSDAKVIEPAAYPAQPSSPNKKRNYMMGLIIGTFIGIGLTFLLEYLDSSLRTLDDVRSYLKLFPLGMVPFVEIEVDPDQPPVTFENQDHHGHPTRAFWNTSDETLPLYISEAYRIIRTSLSFGSTNDLKLIQITSAVKGEGKTTTACNLGISFAHTGSKTLLIDGDMRKPSLHHILGIGPSDEGLSTVLANRDLWKQAVRQTKIPNLFCLPAGVIPPNPSELLTSRAMKDLLNELKEEFDIILIDSPPVISVADSPIIATYVDGTILVSRASFIPRHVCLRAKNSLETVNGRMIGGILNAVSNRHQSYYYGYYGYYGKYYGHSQDPYGYYGEDSKIKKRKKRSRSSDKKPGQLTRLSNLKEPLLDFVSSRLSQLAGFITSLRSPAGGKKHDEL